MSQVQLPRVRTSRHRPETIHLLRSAIVNLGAALITTLVLRVAILLSVPNSDQRGLSLISRLTHVLVWPLQQVGPFQRDVRSGLTVADLVTLAVIVIALLLALGIVAGWEQEGRRMQSGTSDSSLRP